jgi:Ni/Fe-hydrogenase 1 B-type cytochrome subunit
MVTKRFSNLRPYSKLRRVYVWELQVRFYHWINALMVLILCVTGYLIGNPPGIMSNMEASDQYLFGWIRFIHFVSAYIFVFNILFRLYWGFVGNKYARWDYFLPKGKKFFTEIFKVLRFDIFLGRGEHSSIGHNALAGLSYFVLMLFSFLQILTGFGLYTKTSEWWFGKLFAWVPGFFGGDFALRNWHHSAMWFFVIFTIIHVYLVFYHDYLEGRGEISSMGGGWKFIEEEIFESEEFKRVNNIKEEEVVS